MKSRLAFLYCCTCILLTKIAWTNGQASNLTLHVAPAPAASIAYASPLAQNATAVITSPAGFSPSSYQRPSCNQTSPPASLSGWKRWSDPATWGGSVPGVNGSRGNLTIPCGQFVLFDVPVRPDNTSGVVLSSLIVAGHLMFADNASLPLLGLDADYVIVTGNLTIGTPSQHFGQKVRITLTGGSNIPLTGYDDIGSKVLAAYGGQLNLYGMPGGEATPSWVSLTEPATSGSLALKVDQDVTNWPVGAKVAISSTDFDPLQAEVATIVAAANSTITLDKPLKYSRFAPSAPIGTNNSMPMAAEVALLTRNILIRGSVETAPDKVLVGGHVIVYNTQAAQTIFGVELINMGQQGTLGRYPLHFHMCGPLGSSQMRSNSVHDSLQRGYVIHGTHWLTARDNVAFNTTGHAFMLEDGIEQNNTLLHNLVISSRPASLLIPQTPANTDDQPSGFWSSTPTNSWINNTASGCKTGFWLELNQAVRGASSALPGAAGLSPFAAPLNRFANNTAHSNSQAGLQMYQHGYMPNKTALFSGFTAYKNGEYGMVFHGCMNMVVDGAMVADSMTGVEFNEQSFNMLQNSVVLGQTSNWGNPVGCRGTAAACEPIAGDCSPGFNYTSVPDSPGPGYRTVSPDFRSGSPQYGLVLAANAAVGNVFANFNSTCRASGAVGLDELQGGAIPATGVLRNNSVINTPLSSRALIDPGIARLINQYWTAHDADGSTIGARGYLVANGSALLIPPGGNASCEDQPTWGGYSCRNVCYRSIFVNYYEPGVQSLGGGGGSVLNFTRGADAASQVLWGDHSYAQSEIQMGPAGPTWSRNYYVNLLAGYNYTIAFQGGAGLLPTEIKYGYTDTSSGYPLCNATVSLTFPQGVAATQMSS